MAVNRYYNRFRRFCAVLIGAVFVLSGTFKLMDPVGTSLIVGEYWNFFHLAFMRWSSMPAGVLLALLETFTGIALMSGVMRRTTAIVTSVMCLCFTLLTVVLMIFNPTMDCGCFGEVVHLTHTQSFVKNLVLLVLCCGAFLPFRGFGIPGRMAFVSAALSAASSVILLVWSLMAIPLKDYTDLKVGTRLEASLDESESAFFGGRFIYSRDGEERSFTLEEDLPDSSWTFERIEEGESHERTAFLSLRDPQTGAYADSLAAAENVLVISTYRTATLKPAARKLMEAFSSTGATVLHLSLEPEPAAELVPGWNYLSDRRTLMSLNRSNGGATLIQDGIIVRKWPATHLPSVEDLEELAGGEAADNTSDSVSRSNMLQQAYLLWIFVLLLLL